MSATLLQRLLDNRAKDEERRNALLASLEKRIADVKEGEDSPRMTAEEETEYRELLTKIKASDERIPELREQIAADEAAAAARRQLGVMAQHVRIKSEPLTYRQGGQYSWFKDVARASDPGQRDPQAAERLQRHRKELDVIMESAGAEQRANMNTTDGTGGEFVPPLWLVNQYVPLARAGRVTAELCRMVPLPPGTDSINMPTVATGSTVAAQTQGAAASRRPLASRSSPCSFSTSRRSTSTRSSSRI